MTKSSPSKNKSARSFIGPRNFNTENETDNAETTIVVATNAQTQLRYQRRNAQQRREFDLLVTKSIATIKRVGRKTRKDLIKKVNKAMEANFKIYKHERFTYDAVQLQHLTSTQEEIGAEQVRALLEALAKKKVVPPVSPRVGSWSPAPAGFNPAPLLPLPATPSWDIVDIDAAGSSSPAVLVL